MKRGFLTLLVLVFAAGICTAQVRQGNFSQRGMASQEMQTDGLSAAHPSLPIGSKARVTNVANSQEIEVTITGRIPASVNRIIDLSPGAALALDLGFRGEVIVSVPNPPRPSAQLPEPVVVAQPEPEPEPVVIAELEPEPEPVIIAEPEPEPEPVVIAVAPEPLPEPVIIYAQPPAEPKTEAPPPQSPVNITIYNYIVNPDPAPAAEHSQSPDLDYLAWLTLMAMEARGSQTHAPVQETPHPAPQPAPPPVTVVVQQQPQQPQQPVAPPQPAPPPPPIQYGLFDLPVYDVEIVPSLPNPNTNKVYRLQVGAFSVTESANRAVRQLQAAGFEAVLEYTNNMYRVLAVGIAAPNVYYAAQRLGAIGFKQVWVRE